MASWKTVRLGDILTESKVESSAPSIEKRIRVLLNAKGVIKRPIKKETKGATKYFIRESGQFIYGKQNIHKGAFGIVSDTLNGFESTSDLPAFDVDDSCLPLWIDYYLKKGDFYLSLLSIARGAATKRVQPKELLELKIPLPSIDEQMKIIEGFKGVETEGDELKTELAYQQTLLKKLRQQILQEAIEGKLTTDWRAENPDIESASELLARIKAEKEQLIQDKKNKTQKALPPITDEEKPFALPDGWAWCLLDEIVHFTNGKAHEKFIDSSGKYILVNSKYISMNGKVVKRTAQCMCPVYKNDILIVMSDVPNGKALARCLLVGEGNSYTLNQRIGALSPFGALLPDFLALQLNRNQHFLSFNDGKKQTNLRKGQILSCPLAIPSLLEQKVIVTKVEKLFAICDQLETQITNNQTHAEKLMQAVLKEAFQQSDTEHLL